MLFKTNNQDIVNYCRTQFSFEFGYLAKLNLVSSRSRKFEAKYSRTDIL